MSFEKWGPFVEVIGKLTKFRDFGNLRGMALCPAHNDSDPSLSVAIGTKAGKTRLVLRCHGKNCPSRSIMQAIGLNMSYLFSDHYDGKARPAVAMPQSSKTVEERWFEAAVYAYSRKSELYYETIRYENEEGQKKFSFRRPARDGETARDGWIWNVREVERILYNMEQIDELRQAKSNRMVWLHEGEKKADLMANAFGYVATCSPFGAKKWREEFVPMLEGLNVAIIPDRDQDGFDHAMQVARSLVGKAAAVFILPLPGLEKKGDFVDWYFQKEITSDEVRRQRQREFDAMAKSRMIRFQDLKSLEAVTDLEFLFDGMAATGAARPPTVGGLVGAKAGPPPPPPMGPQVLFGETDWGAVAAKLTAEFVDICQMIQKENANIDPKAAARFIAAAEKVRGAASLAEERGRQILARIESLPK